MVTKAKSSLPHEQPFNVNPRPGAKKLAWWNKASPTYWRNRK